MQRFQLVIAFLIGISHCAMAVESVDPLNDGSQFAYAANLRWINAAPLGNGGPGWRITEDGATGWLWLILCHP